MCKKSVQKVSGLALAEYKEIKSIKADITNKWREMIQENRRRSSSPEVANSPLKKKRRVRKVKSLLGLARKQKSKSGSNKSNADLIHLVTVFEKEKAKAEREDNAKRRTKRLVATVESEDYTPTKKRTFLAKDALQEYWDNLFKADHQSDIELAVILRDTSSGKRFGKTGYTFDARGRLKDSFTHIKSSKNKSEDFAIEINEQKRIITTAPKYKNFLKNSDFYNAKGIARTVSRKFILTRDEKDAFKAILNKKKILFTVFRRILIH